MEISTIFIDEDSYSHAENKVALELQISGTFKWVRQYPIGKYFADFYFPDLNVVLEIDGAGFHSSPEAIEHDNWRDKFMNKKGFTVVRVSGRYAGENPAGILDSLRLFPEGRTFTLGSESDMKYLQQTSIGIIT